jgi:hypothetical protein
VKGVKIKSVDHGVRVGMNLFGGEIEENIEGLSGKRVIGSVEKVRFIGKDGKEIEIEAKIDTGADSSAIDRALAEELGFGEALQYFDTINPVLPEDQETGEKLRESLKRAHLRQDIPDLKDIVFVYASNGVSMRPKIGLTLVMDGQEISASPTVVDRSSLQYRAIIGRRNLGMFLVDVSKK